MARLIDADALLRDIESEINKKTKVILLADYNDYYCSGMRNAIRLVKRLPTVEPVKHGHWVQRNSVGSATCSICNGLIFNYYDNENHNYCPKCGAKMEGDCFV